MKIVHNVLIGSLLWLLMACQYASAAEAGQQNQAISERKAYLLIEYFQMLKVDMLVNGLARNYFERVKSEGVYISKEFEDNLVNGLSRFDMIVKMYGPIYNKHLTEKELEAVLGFFKSPLGKKTMELELKGIRPDEKSFNESELEQLKAFKQSSEWKSIEAKTPLMSKDAILMTNYMLSNMLKEASKQYPEHIKLGQD